MSAGCHQWVKRQWPTPKSTWSN